MEKSEVDFNLMITHDIIIISLSLY